MEAGFDRGVFVNVPYDSQFKSLLRPLLFCLIYAGMTPRLALERRDSGELRLNKIVELIRNSKYAIHDLSRMQAQEAGEFFRLNMPFELGLDIGCRLFSKDERSSKRCLILDTERFRYQAAISDLAGTDFGAHADEPNRRQSPPRSQRYELHIRHLGQSFARARSGSPRFLGDQDKGYITAG